MLKTNIKQRGFTIVELLIVIVVIGILAALVLNTFAGVQERARDTERQTDVDSLATQLEAYYTDHGGYPQLSQITAGSVTTLFPGASADIVEAPNDDDGFSLVGNASTVPTEYGYVALDDVGGACAADDACVSFTLSYTTEDDGDTDPTEIKSLNN